MIFLSLQPCSSKVIYERFDCYGIERIKAVSSSSQSRFIRKAGRAVLDQVEVSYNQTKRARYSCGIPYIYVSAKGKPCALINYVIISPDVLSTSILKSKYTYLNVFELQPMAESLKQVFSLLQWVGKI